MAAAAFAALVPVAGGQNAAAQKIICWKDASGKVIGCGDRVPPEYQGSGTKELDKRGITRRTTESYEDAAKRRAQEEELARQKAEEQKRLAEQRRQDAALLATFANESEIDQKRDRELAQIDAQITQLRVSLRNVAERESDLQARAKASEKAKMPAPSGLQEDINRIGLERQRLEESIASREKDKVEVRQRYAEDKRRYLELRGRAPQATATNPPSGTAPSRKY